MVCVLQWKLMVASCHRRIQNFANALRIYQDIHAQYPDNVECLRYLVHICGEQQMKEQAHEYVLKLRKAERDAEVEAARKERQEQERKAIEMEQETQMQGSVPRLSMDEMNPGAAHGSPAQQQEHYQQQAPQYGQQPSPQQQAYPQATSPHQSPVQPSPQRKQAAEVRASAPTKHQHMS